MIEVEKNIPLPRTETAGKYPWHSMEVGESFFVTGDVKRVRNVLCSSFGRFKPKKFSLRKVEGGVRCWRIE